jgi:prevent-host-death family protein
MLYNLINKIILCKYIIIRIQYDYLKELIIMVTIRPSVDLRNNYNEISKLCKERKQPVFITKNGHGDLAVMSMELYNQLAGRHELYKLLDEGMEAVKNGQVRPFEDAMADLRKRIAK